MTGESETWTNDTSHASHEACELKYIGGKLVIEEGASRLA